VTGEGDGAKGSSESGALGMGVGPAPGDLGEGGAGEIVERIARLTVTQDKDETQYVRWRLYVKLCVCVAVVFLLVTLSSGEQRTNLVIWAGPLGSRHSMFSTDTTTIKVSSPVCTATTTLCH
jgi:hypothetical protein